MRDSIVLVVCKSPDESPSGSLENRNHILPMAYPDLADSRIDLSHFSAKASRAASDSVRSDYFLRAAIAAVF